MCVYRGESMRARYTAQSSGGAYKGIVCTLIGISVHAQDMPT